MPNLESLALTSPLFNINSESKTINVLQAAAGAAMEMPKSQTMEIYNQDHAQVFIFRYRCSLEGIPTITVSSTWDHSPDSEVLSAWGRVGHKHTRCAVALTRKHLKIFHLLVFWTFKV